MNPHVNTEHYTLYSTTQQKGYTIQEANHLLVLPCVIQIANKSVLLIVMNKKRKSQVRAQQNANLATLTTTVKPLQIYIDSDWGGDKETGRSTSGGIIFLYGNHVAWFCQKQSDVSLSTSEAEYKTQTYAFKEGMYFINLIQSEMDIQLTPVETLIDNIGAAYMAEQVVTNKKTKHISLSYHYAREQVQIFKNYYLTYVNTTLNCSDIFTKALDRGLFERHRNYIFKIEDEVGNNNNNN